MFLQFAQKFDDFRLIPIHRADELAPHFAVTVNDVGLWKFEGSVEVVAFLVGVANGKERDPVIFQEAVVGALVGVDTDRKDCHSLVLQPLLHLHQGRHFLDARWTPCRPEVQHNRLPTELAQSYGPVGILYGEIGRQASDTGWPRAAVAAK